MPISATGTSSSPSSSRWARATVARSFGFTLLELLVVIAIIGVFVGVFVLSTDLASFERKLEQEAQRLAGLLSLVQEEALLQSRDYGILFTEKSYRFYFYDHIETAWIAPADDRLLAPYTLDEMRLALLVDGIDVILEREFDAERFEDPEPQVMILSSGEMSPFELNFLRDNRELETFAALDEEKATLIAELDGTLEVIRGAL